MLMEHYICIYGTSQYSYDEADSAVKRSEGAAFDFFSTLQADKRFSFCSITKILHSTDDNNIPPIVSTLVEFRRPLIKTVELNRKAKTGKLAQPMIKFMVNPFAEEGEEVVLQANAPAGGQF